MLKATTHLLNSVWCPLKTSIRYNPYPISFMYLLQNIPPLQTTKLENGLTVVTEERECNHASLGIFVDAGSRYESDFENGITHFFEHIVFKGTFARSRTMLEDQMSCTGAKYKCYTSREMATYYAECLSHDVPLTVDILTDCIFNNSFSSAEIEAQKKVVYMEMQDHDSDSNELLDDFLHSAAFQGSPLSKTIMGPSCNLHNFNSSTIPTFLNRFYDANRTVLVGVGGVNHEQMVSLACRYLSKLEPHKCMDMDVYRYTGSDIRYRNDSMPVANVAIAVEGPSLCDDDSIIMEVASNMIGGWDRSQPGGLGHGFHVAKATSSTPLCDAYRSFNLNYKDCGLWGVKFLGPSMMLDDMVCVVQDQWMKLCHMATDMEVERARKNLKTKMLSKYESTASTCLELGRWVLYQGYRAPLHERISAVDRVRAEDVRDCCYRYLYDKCPTVAAIGPVCGLTDYVRIRSGMWWMRY